MNLPHEGFTSWLKFYIGSPTTSNNVADSVTVAVAVLKLTLSFEVQTYMLNAATIVNSGLKPGIEKLWERSC